jgi:hypothetical protein
VTIKAIAMAKLERYFFIYKGFVEGVVHVIYLKSTKTFHAESADINAEIKVG